MSDGREAILQGKALFVAMIGMSVNMLHYFIEGQEWMFS